MRKIKSKSKLMNSATEQLQQQLRNQLNQGSYVLPPLKRWGGAPFWGVLIRLSRTEAESFRTQPPHHALISGEAPVLGLAIGGSYAKESERLAFDIDCQGYGGIVQFNDYTHEDTFLRIVFGESQYPILVPIDQLKDFWAELTLGCCRHFLMVAHESHCYGCWESDLLLS
jgi:hypothetical protein